MSMSQHSDSSTIRYYDDYADRYIADTVGVDMDSLYQPFLELLPEGGTILDAGSGSGRDTKAFAERGYSVSPIDASIRMVEATTRLTGIPAKRLRFQCLEEQDEFDGIWACASLLHIPLSELDDVLVRFANALRPNGVCYLSFKEGAGERTERGRHFTDFTEDSLQQKLSEQSLLRVMETWTTNDLRSGRTEIRWVNVLLQKCGST